MPEKSSKKISHHASAPSSEQSMVLAEWTFPEYEQHERTRGWFIVAGIISGAMVLWGIINANYLFAFIIIMVAVIIVTHHYNQPPAVEFQITEEGLQLGEHQYPYAQIANFWIIYEPPEVKKLYFRFKEWYHPRLAVPLHEQNPLKIRSILLDYLEEDLNEEEEPTTDILARKWKL